MRCRIPGLPIAGAILLAACGRPDASGVYLLTTDREATLIRLSQDKDGAVTGRVETIAIGPDGVVDDQSAALDGSASGHDLRFKPTRAWSGALGPAGAFTREGLALVRGGAPVQARKASLADFQKAVSQLKARAAQARRRAVEAEAGPAGGAAEATAFEGAADKGAKLETATAALRADAAKLDEAVSAAPDFARQAVDNTARIAQMARQAPALSRADRGRLAEAAGQVIVQTNQIDVLRSQYAVRLSRIVQRAAPTATAVERFCEAQGAAFAGPCAAATAAATHFESAQVRAAVVFKGYREAVQAELTRQNQLAEKVGG